MSLAKNNNFLGILHLLQDVDDGVTVMVMMTEMIFIDHLDYFFNYYDNNAIKSIFTCQS